MFVCGSSGEQDFLLFGGLRKQRSLCVASWCAVWFGHGTSEIRVRGSDYQVKKGHNSQTTKKHGLLNVFIVFNNSKIIDEYVRLRTEASSSPVPAGMESIVNRMLQRCFEDHQYTQVRKEHIQEERDILNCSFLLGRWFGYWSTQTRCDRESHQRVGRRCGDYSLHCPDCHEARRVAWMENADFEEVNGSMCLCFSFLISFLSRIVEIHSSLPKPNLVDVFDILVHLDDSESVARTLTALVKEDRVRKREEEQESPDSLFLFSRLSRRISSRSIFVPAALSAFWEMWEANWLRKQRKLLFWQTFWRERDGFSWTFSFCKIFLLEILCFVLFVDLFFSKGTGTTTLIWPSWTWSRTASRRRILLHMLQPLFAMPSCMQAQRGIRFWERILRWEIFLGFLKKVYFPPPPPPPPLSLSGSLVLLIGLVLLPLLDWVSLTREIWR